MPRLDLTPPDFCRQLAEFCVEFPRRPYEEIFRACRTIEIKLEELLQTAREPRTEGE